MSADFLSCKTDMWSSRNGDGYIAPTCHFIDPDVKMCWNNLQTYYFPGTRNHTALVHTLNTAAKLWYISFDNQLMAFTIGSEYYIIKSLKDLEACICRLHFKLGSSKSLANIHTISKI